MSDISSEQEGDEQAIVQAARLFVEEETPVVEYQIVLEKREGDFARLKIMRTDEGTVPAFWFARRTGDHWKAFALGAVNQASWRRVVFQKPCGLPETTSTAPIKKSRLGRISPTAAWASPSKIWRRSSPRSAAVNWSNSSIDDSMLTERRSEVGAPPVAFQEYRTEGPACGTHISRKINTDLTK